MLNFEYQYKFKEFATACFLMTYQSKILKIVVILVTLINLATLFLQIKYQHHSMFQNTINFLFPFLVGFIISILSPIVQFKKIKGKAITLQIQNNYLKSKVATISSEIGWDNILKVVKIGEMIGFFYNQNCAILLPLKVVNEAEKQEIRQICEQKNIPNKF